MSSYSLVSAALSGGFCISVLIGTILKCGVCSCVFGFKNFGGDLFLKVLPPLLHKLLKPRMFLPGCSESILRRLCYSLPK